MATVSIETADGRKVSIEDEHTKAAKLVRLAVEALDEIAPDPKREAGFKAPAARSWLDDIAAYQPKLQPASFRIRTGFQP